MDSKICQCCGMPLDDESIISVEKDGSKNYEYCKWCYTDGEFTYKTKDKLLDFIVSHMPNPDNQSEEERRAVYDACLSELKYWKSKT